MTHGPSTCPTHFRFGQTSPDPNVGKYARSVAVVCVLLMIADQCKVKRIFAPGDNVREAAVHDLDAIVGIAGPAGGPLPHPALLHWTADPPVDSGWYVGKAPCTDYAPKECDEYPYRTTEEANVDTSSIRPILKADNKDEGIYYSAFLAGCSVTTSADESFLVIPVISPTGTRDNPVTYTSAWCLGT